MGRSGKGKKEMRLESRYSKTLRQVKNVVGTPTG